MLILKRLIVWLIERLIEALFLGALLGYLLHISLTGFRFYALAVAVVLLLSGYYFTTAFFGVIWRSATWWLYPALAATLFLIHGEIVFLQGKGDFTAEGRATEIPFLLAGACVVFACSFAGARILRKWQKETASRTPYVSATVLTLLVFALANIAHFARVTSNDEFRHDGLPFSFFREGGFTTGYHWHGGTFLWLGVIGNAVLLIAVATLLGKGLQYFNAVTARDVPKI